MGHMWSTCHTMRKKVLRDLLNFSGLCWQEYCICHRGNPKNLCAKSKQCKSFRYTVSYHCCSKRASHVYVQFVAVAMVNHKNNMRNSCCSQLETFFYNKSFWDLISKKADLKSYWWHFTMQYSVQRNILILIDFVFYWF